jgi:protein-arginine kinase activator protein McsA
MNDLGDFDDSSEMDHIESLRDNSKQTMMNMIYNAVINGEEKAIKSDSPPKQKVEALNNILNFFVKREEYEKCSNIKKIIDKIKC